MITTPGAGPEHRTEANPGNIRVGVDRISVVFPLGDFDPESALVDWQLRVDGLLVDAEGSLCDWFDAHPVVAPRGKRAQVNYTGKYRLGSRAEVRLEVWAHSIDVLPESIMSGEEQWWARVEVNPARLLDPEGWKTCPADLAGPLVVALVIRLAREGIVVPACPHLRDVEAGLALTEQPPGWGGCCESWDCHNAFSATRRAANPWERAVHFYGLSLNRLDCTLDVLDVEDIPLYREVVRSTPQKRLRTKEDGRGDRYIAVSNGTRGVRFVLYDNHRKGVDKRSPVASRAPVGTMRLEAQVHKDWLRNHGYMSRAEDITQARVNALFLSSFHWAGLDRAVGGTPSVWPRSGLPGVQKNQTRNFRRWMFDQARGEASLVSAGTRRSFHGIARRCGFVVGLPPDARLGHARRIDLDEGREVPITAEWAAQNDFTPWRRKRSE